MDHLSSFQLAHVMTHLAPFARFHMRGCHRIICSLLYDDDWHTRPNICCERGWLHSIAMLERKYAKSAYVNYDNCLYWACRGGHRELVDFFIIRGADDWDIGLRGACYGGYREIVELMITRGAVDWESGLRHACFGGQREIVKLMIAKGARNWNYAFEGACLGGHRDLVELMIARGVNCWDSGLIAAHAGQHDEIVDFLIKRGARKECIHREIDYCFQYSGGLFANVMIRRSVSLWDAEEFASKV